ncbi:hypothetical protein BAUCODRAFT_125340 [Baudoinia panamericana UAMH 10762]|uniref:Uncharacterized protein n=1 Tax=Baudoinia panamericana (strain UAMH 10762) TaxID=717646 RepID=M2LH75_BAUPA|nr:uncharacterized protein BAUCODRAFT_125340 [Baudoinia panamericana UAMH 10762]EMC93482.1 hypothetical protein BAUCODRAFT_125340 [Baudoinia panamericana UAMH 10762]
MGMLLSYYRHSRAMACATGPLAMECRVPYKGKACNTTWSAAKALVVADVGSYRATTRFQSERRVTRSVTVNLADDRVIRWLASL